MNCYVFDVHINCCFAYEKSEYNLVEFGPLNMINSQTLSEISAILQKMVDRIFYVEGLSGTSSHWIYAINSQSGEVHVGES